MVGLQSKGCNDEAVPNIEVEFITQWHLEGCDKVCLDSFMLQVGVWGGSEVSHCCVCRDVNTMTMSDWQVFIAAVSPVVCSDVTFPAAVMELWAPLREALMYFTRYHHGQHSDTRIADAQHALLQYACLAEQKFKLHKLTTLQLHSAVVHLADMVRAYGPAAFRMEFWVERMMQVLKRVTKFRTTCSPELVAVNAWLLQIALMRMEGREPGVASLHQAVDPKAKTIMAHVRDVHDQDGNTLTGALKDSTDDVVRRPHWCRIL